MLSAGNEGALTERRAQSDLFERDHVGREAGPVSIRAVILRRTVRLVRGPINSPAWVRKGCCRCPRAGWQTRLRAAPGYSDTRQCTARRARRCRERFCEVPRVRMVLPGHHRSCQHRCGDQCRRQKFELCHSSSPSDMKSDKVSFSWRWRSNRPFEDNIASRCFNSARRRACGSKRGSKPVQVACYECGAPNVLLCFRHCWQAVGTAAVKAYCVAVTSAKRSAVRCVFTSIGNDLMETRSLLL